MIKTRWINVAERLPDEHGHYSVTVESWCILKKAKIREVIELFWQKGFGWSRYCDGCQMTYKEDYFGKVLAWQPMPPAIMKRLNANATHGLTTLTCDFPRIESHSSPSKQMRVSFQQGRISIAAESRSRCVPYVERKGKN